VSIGISFFGAVGREEREKKENDNAEAQRTLSKRREEPALDLDS
jgi:hypothetical protein